MYSTTPRFVLYNLCPDAYSATDTFVLYNPPMYVITVLPQSNQSAGPVRFLIFCSISIILLASPVAGRKPQWTAGAD
jgi:hypothetical protein